MRRRTLGLFTASLSLGTTAALLPAAHPTPATTGSVVVGGHPVSVADVPWMVALSSRDRFGGTRSGQFCGGAVVDRSTVLTAAHCLSTETLGIPLADVHDLKIITGRDDLGTREGREIAVSRTQVAPTYDSRTNAADVAALTLESPLSQTSVLSVAPQGDKAYQPGTEATVYGWGDVTGAGDYAAALRAADVRILSDEDCKHAYPGNSEGIYLAGSMLCAGADSGGKDACQGDSGGPLVAHEQLIGLVSWGSGCGRAERPGVYARISGALDDGATPER